MQNQQTRQIGDHEYTVLQLPAITALKLLTRIGKGVGPALGELAKALSSQQGKSLQDMDIGAVGAGMAALLAGLEGDELLAILTTLYSTTSYTEFDPKAGQPRKYELANPSVVNAHFQGKVTRMLQVAAFALEANYADFFDGLRGQLARAPIPAKASLSA